MNITIINNHKIELMRGWSAPRIIFKQKTNETDIIIHYTDSDLFAEPYPEYSRHTYSTHRGQGGQAVGGVWTKRRVCQECGVGLAKKAGDSNFPDKQKITHNKHILFSNKIILLGNTTGGMKILTVVLFVNGVKLSSFYWGSELPSFSHCSQSVSVRYFSVWFWSAERSFVTTSHQSQGRFFDSFL